MLENIGPPLGNATLGEVGAIPGAGREDVVLAAVLAAAALRAAGIAGGAGGGGGGTAGLLSDGTPRDAGSSFLGDCKGGATAGVGATGLTGAGGAEGAGIGGGAIASVAGLSVGAVASCGVTNGA